MASISRVQKRAVLYARVSSDEQDREGFSIPAQKKLLVEYAAKHGFDIVEEYIEVETAKQTGRKSFNAMIEFLKKQKQTKLPEKQCRVILVEKTDRLYRNLKDYVAFEDLDIEVHFVKENVVLSRDSHSNEHFVHGIKVLMARQYVQNLGEEVKKGMKEKAAQGIWPSKAPTGYMNVDGPDGKKIVARNPETADIVVRMFEQYATGNYSLEEVGEMARSQGLVFNRTRNLRAIVQCILKNSFYYGDFVWKGEKYRGVHTPLVTRQLWDKVQEQGATRSTRKIRKSVRNFAFSRLVRCGQCGCALVGEMKKGKYVYYHCTEYKQKCGEKYVREETLEEKFTEILRSLHFETDVLEWLTMALRESKDDETKFREESVSRLQAEYNTLQRRIDAMYLDKLDGRIDVAFFDAKRSEWRDEQDRIMESIGDHQRASENYINEGILLMELATQAADLFAKQPPREKRKLLDFVLSNCEWSDGVLTPNFRQPFDMIADTAAAAARKKAAGASSSDLCQLKLPERNPLRNNTLFFKTVSTNENTGFGEFETLSVPCQTVATAYEQSMFELTETSRFALTKLSFFCLKKRRTAELTASAKQTLY